MSARACKWDWLVFAALAAFVTALVLRAGNSDFTYPDASRHAMDGVFLLDALAERPLEAPMEWAKDYYVRSPALGIGRYPPLMALLQVPFYAMLGVSPLAARLAVGLVWLGGCVIFYEVARRALGRAAAAFAAAVMAAGPAAVRWTGEVMLELPAIAFLCGGAYFVTVWLESGKRKHLLCAVAAVCLAGWVKQPAALLVVVVFGCVVARRGASRKALWDIVAAVALAAAVLAPLAVLSVWFGRANLMLLAGAGGQFGLFSVRNWLFYLAEIPSWYIGWPAVVFMVAGAAAGIAGRAPRQAWLWAAWGALFYLAFSIIGYKSARLAMFVLPACAWFAGAGLAALAEGGGVRKGLVYAAAVLAVSGTATLSLLRLPETSHIAARAAHRALVEAPERILYSGFSNGTFIFRIRELAGRRKPVVVRADKVFRPALVQHELGEANPRWTTAELEAKVAAIAPDVVVIEAKLPPTFVDRDPLRMLAEYALTGNFEELAAFEGPGEARIAVYRYAGRREAGPIEIVLPGVGMSLELDGGI